MIRNKLRIFSDMPILFGLSLFVFLMLFSFFRPLDIVYGKSNDDHKTWICHVNNSNVYGSCGFNLIEVDNDSIDGEGTNDHTQHPCEAFPEVVIQDIIPAIDSNRDGQLDKDDCYCSIDQSFCRISNTSSSTSSATSTVSSDPSTTLSISSSNSSSTSSGSIIDNGEVGGVQDYDPQNYTRSNVLVDTGSENLVLRIVNFIF